MIQCIRTWVHRLNIVDDVSDGALKDSECRHLKDMLNKVPAITIYFWIIKILATTVGETVADFLNVKLGLGLTITSLIMGAAFVVGLALQMTRKRYIPAVYWTVVVLISVVGTLISDTLVDRYHIALWETSTVFAIMLAVVFVAWQRSEKTLSVHDIRTTKRETFYWSAILFTFALGTSAGDLIAEASHLGYPLSVLLFASGIALTYAAYKIFKINGILAFWIAYILTRPLGASTGDLLSQPVANGGLGVGTTVTSAVFLTIIVGMTIFLTDRLKRIERRREEASPA